MKKVFTDEVARELGYQKYWPERSDWFLGISGALLIMGIVSVGIFEIMKQTGYLDRQNAVEAKNKLSIIEWCSNTKQMTLQETLICNKYK